VPIAPKRVRIGPPLSEASKINLNLSFSLSLTGSRQARLGLETVSTGLCTYEQRLRELDPARLRLLATILVALRRALSDCR
jgi:hypothetical protein